MARSRSSARGSSAAPGRSPSPAPATRCALWDEDRRRRRQGRRSFIADALPDLGSGTTCSTARRAGGGCADIDGEDDLATALAGAAHVQENTPEDVEMKKRVFAAARSSAGAETRCSPARPRRILPSRFTEALPGRHRCLVVHPINPPYLIPAAEVVPAPWTDPEVVERTRAFIVAAGQAPIVMKRELDGFIMNRMQGALLEEAFRLVADGYASVEDVDVGIREGLGAALVLHGAVRDHRPQCAGRRARLCRALPAASTNACSRRCSAASTGPARCSRRSSASAARRCRRTTSASARCWRDRRLMALAAHKRAARDRYRIIERASSMATKRQSHHHLRRHRRDPHAVDVAASAGHRPRRSPTRRSARPRPAPPSCTCMRATRRTAGPTRRPRPSRLS